MILRKKKKIISKRINYAPTILRNGMYLRAEIHEKTHDKLDFKQAARRFLMILSVLSLILGKLDQFFT